MANKAIKRYPLGQPERFIEHEIPEGCAVYAVSASEIAAIVPIQHLAMVEARPHLVKVEARHLRRFILLTCDQSVPDAWELIGIVAIFAVWEVK